MEFKKVIVSTISTRKFVEGLLYLGSIGGQLEDNCTVIKGLYLRAEVMLPADTPVDETPEIKVAAGVPVKKEEKPVAKKTTARKTTNKKKEDAEKQTEEQDAPETEGEVKEA